MSRYLGYSIVALSLFGAWALFMRLGIMSVSMPFMLMGAAVLAVIVSHRVK
jgi:hypothetical protein